MARQRADAEQRNVWLSILVGILRVLLTVVTKPRWYHAERIPRTGGAILVCNHISVADPPVISHCVYDAAGRVPRFLAKESLFRAPVLGFFLRRIGQIPVKRGSVDAAHSLEAAAEVLNSGGVVVVYPEGTCTQDPSFWPMKGRTGVARLSAMADVPVIPVVQWGAQGIYQRFTKKIRLWRVPVEVSVGEPIELPEIAEGQVDHGALRAATDRIMLRLREDLATLRGVPVPDTPLWKPNLRRPQVGSAHGSADDPSNPRSATHE